MKTHTQSGIALSTAVPNAFFDAYVTCALWSSTYEDGERDDKPLDDGEHDLATETADKMLLDCADFFSYCEAEGIDPLPDYGHGQYCNAELSGHDFWLTRNGHGAGYWDRGLDTGDVLTSAAKTFGSSNLYVGDDGMIHVS